MLLFYDCDHSKFRHISVNCVNFSELLMRVIFLLSKELLAQLSMPLLLGNILVKMRMAMESKFPIRLAIIKVAAFSATYSRY